MSDRVRLPATLCGVLLLLSLAGCASSRPAAPSRTPRTATHASSVVAPGYTLAIQSPGATLAAGSSAAAVVSLTNTTNASDTTTWLGAAIASARKQVAWGAQYLGPNGAIIHRPAGSRGTLTRSLGPGQTTSWRYEFQVPLQPGAYRITAVSGLGHVTLSPSVAFRSVRAPVTAAGLTGVWISDVYPYSRPGPTPTRVTIDLRADGRAIIRYPREPSPNEAAWVFTAPDTLRFDLRTLGFGTSSASYRVTQAGDRVTLELLRGVPGVLLPQTRTIALKRMAPGPASTAALIPPGLSVTLRDAGAAPESKLMGFRAQTRARELAGPGWTQASSIEMRRVMLRHTSGRADEKLVWVVVLRDITTYSHGPDPNPGGRLSTRVIVFDANTGAEEFGTSWGGGYVAP